MTPKTALLMTALLGGVLVAASAAMAQTEVPREVLLNGQGVRCSVQYWDDRHGTDVHLVCENRGSSRARVRIKGPNVIRSIPYQCVDGGLDSRDGDFGSIRAGRAARREHTDVCSGRGGLRRFNAELDVDRD